MWQVFSVFFPQLIIFLASDMEGVLIYLDTHNSELALNSIQRFSLFSIKEHCEYG